MLCFLLAAIIVHFLLIGCSNDLSKATEIAYAYVKNLGMSEDLSLISVSDRIKTSDQYDYMVDMEVKKLLKV